MQNRTSKIMTGIFFFVETLLYIIFLTLDAKQIDSTTIKFLSIIFCFLYTLIDIKNWNIKLINARIIAFLTIICDLFLLVLNKNYEIGTTIFLFVQIGYFINLSFIMEQRHFKISLFIRGVISLIAAIIIGIVENGNVLYVISAVYFIMEIFNLFDSVILYFNRKKKFILIFTLGMLLFIGCDICVGLNNIIDYNAFVQYGMWFFYLPSQVLLVLYTTKSYIKLS